MPVSPNPADLAAWLRLLESRHRVSIDLGLERVAEVYRLMGAPRPATKILTVAGTNGKGSTVSYLAAMAGALGRRCGTYTSPHLIRYNERIRIGDRNATDEQIVEAFERIESSRGDISLSYFEFGTLAAFHILSRARLDYAILEVGLGGRLDAVNIIDADCAVITPIGIDHQEYLGEDRESIGAEKAGIIRPGRPVVCGEARLPATVIAAASELKSPLYLPGRDYYLDSEPLMFRFPAAGVSVAVTATRLAGTHQQHNRALALASLLLCEPDAKRHMSELVEASSDVVLEGRLQTLCDRPHVIADVGHNPAAAAMVAAYLEDYAQYHGGAHCVCVLGMLADKETEAVVGELQGQVAYWFCAGLSGPRGQSGARLAAKVAACVNDGGTAQRVSAFEDVSGALSAAMNHAGHDGAPVLVFGSFVTVAQAVGHLECI